MFLKEPSHWLMLIVVLLLLFGSRRLPDTARGIGRSLRIFKSELKQMNDDDSPAPRPAPEADRAPLEGRVLNADQEPERSPAREAGRDV